MPRGIVGGQRPQLQTVGARRGTDAIKQALLEKSTPARGPGSTDSTTSAVSRYSSRAQQNEGQRPSFANLSHRDPSTTLIDSGCA